APTRSHLESFSSKIINLRQLCELLLKRFSFNLHFGNVANHRTHHASAFNLELEHTVNNVCFDDSHAKVFGPHVTTHYADHGKPPVYVLSIKLVKATNKFPALFANLI